MESKQLWRAPGERPRRVLAAGLAALTLAFALHGEAPWAPLAGPSAASAELPGPRGEGASAPAPARAGGEAVAAPAAPLRLDVPVNTVTKDKSWGETLAECLAGWTCFFMSICILWLNEGHAVRMDQLFTFAARRLRAVPASPALAENVRELVFVTGEARTGDTLQLNDWALLEAPQGSAKLRAKVWMYQWVEEEKSEKDKTTYTYKQDWVHHYVDSGKFHLSDGHYNPPPPQPFSSLQLAATSLGDFALSKLMLGRLQKWQPCSVEGKLQDFQQIPSLKSYSLGEVAMHEGKKAVFFGTMGRPQCPGAGDLMVHFEYVPCGPTSVLGVQVACQPPNAGAWTLTPMQFVQRQSYTPSFARAATATTNLGDEKHQTLLGERELDEYVEEAHDPMKHLTRGCKASMEGFPSPAAMAEKFMKAACPDQILGVMEKAATATEILSEERAFEKTLTATVRLFGVLLMWVASEAIFSPLNRSLSWIWIVGSILAVGIHIFTCMCTVTCSCCTVGVAHLAYRPLYALGLLAAGALAAVAMLELGHGQGQAAALG